LEGKILVDATARVEYRDPRPPTPPSAARLAQTKLGDHVRVVAAFQNVPAAALRKNLDQPLDEDVLICADDPGDAVEVGKLAAALGMNAFIAGNLDNAIVVEGLTSILISINKHYGSRTASIHVTGVSTD
jgi:predicted dinucleotide-binding enzyme